MFKKVKNYVGCPLRENIQACLYILHIMFLSSSLTSFHIMYGIVKVRSYLLIKIHYKEINS